MTRVPLEEKTKSRLAGLEPDGITVFSLDSGKVRGALLSGTAMVAQARANHRLGILETVALGQAYVCAGLLASTLKGDDRITVRMDCSGPLRGYQVEARASGEVRGYLFNPSITLDRPLESFDLSPFIQGGVLSVTRRQTGRTEPFTGQIELSGGGIAAEMSRYCLLSEQTNTAFFASVRFDREGSLLGSGGLFLQALPGASPEALDWAEKVIAGAPSLGTWFGEGGTRRDFAIRHFLFSGIDFLGEKAVSFECPCERDRFLAFLSAMERQDLEMALKSGARDAEGRPCVEVSCHHCGTSYAFAPAELSI